MNERDNDLIRRAEELSAHSGPESLTITQLLAQMREDAKQLLQMELELAKVEAREDMNAELDLAKGAAISAVCALLGLNMLIVAAVFALAPDFAWVAALVVGLILLATAGISAFVGWRHAQKNPLDTTRATLKEDVEWARQQIK